ncbi:MAG: F0F1 ATP synthase subunit delta [Gammaproteobacteria bacterium]
MTDQSDQNSELPAGEASLARPYAKAVFEMAKNQSGFQPWADKLETMAAVASHHTMREALDNPRLTRSGAADILIKVCGDRIDAGAQNLLRILADNDRLSQLPMIAEQYRQLRDAAEGTVEAEVISAQALKDEQKTSIAGALKKRLGRDVQLNCSVNEELIGGAVIRVGDLVIDGSAAEHLRQLSGTLVH